MGTETRPRVYEKVQGLIESIDGTMKWRPGGGPGGAWELNLRGKTIKVPVRDNWINDLDRLYVSQVENPRTSLDYESPGTLVDDAFWRLVGLFPGKAFH